MSRPKGMGEDTPMLNSAASIPDISKGNFPVSQIYSELEYLECCDSNYSYDAALFFADPSTHEDGPFEIYA